LSFNVFEHGESKTLNQSELSCIMCHSYDQSIPYLRLAITLGHLCIINIDNSALLFCWVVQQRI